MKANYILIASGSSFTPRLDIMIHEDTDGHATEVAQRQIATLCKAGYWNFELFCTKDSDHSRVCSFTVETPAPIVRPR